MGLNLNNIINSQLIVEPNNFFTGDGGVVNQDIYNSNDDSTEYNLVNQTAQTPAQLNIIQLNQQLSNFESGDIQNNHTNSQNKVANNTTTNNNRQRVTQISLTQSGKRFACEHCPKDFKWKHHLTRF